MRTLKCIAGLAFAAGACTVGFAGGPKSNVEPSAEPLVLRAKADVAAQVVPLGNGQYRMVKPWTALNIGSRNNGECSQGEAFDSLDVLWTPKGPGAGTDPNYAIYFDDLITGNLNRCPQVGATGRYRLVYGGTSTLLDNPNSLDDMEITNPSANGADSYEMSFAFSIQYTAGGLPNPPVHFFLIETYDGIADDPNFCNFDPNDPNAAVGDFLSGVLVGFNNVSGMNNHVQFLVNLCNNNPDDIHWVLPTGRGGMHMLSASAATPDPQDPNIINLTPGRGQPMLWYNNNNNAASAIWSLDGDQGSLHYDDDGGVITPPADVDGEFSVFSECFGYVFNGLPCPGNRDSDPQSQIPAGAGRLANGISWLYGNNAGPQCSCTGDIAPSGSPNGVVDINDLTLLLSNFGVTPNDPCIDVNGSGGAIDINDLTALLSAFGTTCP